MLINFVLSLFAIYLLIGLVVFFAVLFFLVSIGYRIHTENNKKEKI